MLTRIIDWSLRHRWSVLFAWVAILAAGLLSFRALPIDAFPDTTPVQVQVNAVAPALAPLEVERQITTRLEAALAGLPRVEDLRSISKFALSQISLRVQRHAEVRRGRYAHVARGHRLRPGGRQLGHPGGERGAPARSRPRQERARRRARRRRRGPQADALRRAHHRARLPAHPHAGGHRRKAVPPHGADGRLRAPGVGAALHDPRACARVAGAAQGRPRGAALRRVAEAPLRARPLLDAAAPAHGHRPRAGGARRERAGRDQARQRVHPAALGGRDRRQRRAPRRGVARGVDPHGRPPREGAPREVPGRGGARVDAHRDAGGSHRSHGRRAVRCVRHAEAARGLEAREDAGRARRRDPQGAGGPPGRAARVHAAHRDAGERDAVRRARRRRSEALRRRPRPAQGEGARDRGGLTGREGRGRRVRRAGDGPADHADRRGSGCDRPLRDRGAGRARRRRGARGPRGGRGPGGRSPVRAGRHAGRGVSRSRGAGAGAGEGARRRTDRGGQARPLPRDVGPVDDPARLGESGASWSRRTSTGATSARSFAEARRAIAEEVELPSGYFVRFGGQFTNLERARARLFLIVPLALALVFLLLYASSGSGWDTLRIFSGVPFALVGGVAALLLRGLPFSISAAVGFVALFGVAVLNGLVLVSRIRQLADGGTALAEAVTQAAISRLRPVLMTASVAALGFVPMALATGPGAEVQRPLATVVIGGVLSSSALTLLVLPVLFTYFARRRGERLAPHQGESPSGDGVRVASMKRGSA